jgi:ATP-dependent Clp protease ATP-binding subunit ClpC
MKTFNSIREETLEEKLKASDPAGKYISDFVHSDNPKFAGKSKKERIRMALGASYGAKKVNDFGNGVGFKTSQSDFIDNENKKGIIKTELKKRFSPEFLNRIDDIVIFNKLTKENLEEITKIQLGLLSERLKEQKLLVSFDDSIITRIMEMTTEENYGARPIKRNIQYLIENYLATQILIKNELLQKETTLFYENNELILK